MLTINTVKGRAVLRVERAASPEVASVGVRLRPVPGHVPADDGRDRIIRLDAFLLDFSEALHVKTPLRNMAVILHFK